MYNILICDDEPDIRSALKIYLSSEGYGIFEAENGSQALDIIAKAKAEAAAIVAEAQAKAKETLEAAKETAPAAPKPNDLVPIRLFKDNDKYKDDVFVAVNGRSMVSNTEMARELGYLHAPDNVLIDIEEINKYPPEKVVLITTGSQGEPLSALSRMAMSEHRKVKVTPNDFIIISARPIPGNEKFVNRVVNELMRLGAEVIYEKMYEVHVSGHACQDEQKLMMALTKPQYILPVHGEYKHLRKYSDVECRY